MVNRKMFMEHRELLSVRKVVVRVSSIWFDWQVIVESVGVLRKVVPTLRT